MPIVWQELEVSLLAYVEFKLRKVPLAQRGPKEAQYDAWKDAILRLCRERHCKAASTSPPNPEGHPGLKQQIQEAQQVLVFGHEDRAPHAIQIVCRRFYECALAAQLATPGTFSPTSNSASEVLSELEFNRNLELPHGNRLPYLHGIWKAKKLSFRWIAGACNQAAESETAQPRQKSHTHVKPKAALSALGSSMVGWLQIILSTLREADRTCSAATGVRRFLDYAKC